MRTDLRARAVAALLALSSAPLLLGAQPGSRTAPAPQEASRLFAFHSSFWVNLHHFLYVTARARKGLDPRRPGVTGALADTAGYGALSSAERGAWETALAHYDSALADRDVLFDPAMVALTTRLVAADSAPSLRGSGIDSTLAMVLERAAPVYRRLWWPRHDAANQRMRESLEALVARHGDSLSRWESRAFRTAWAAVPVRVDIAAYTNVTGAYTTNGPPHITFASTTATNAGEQGLEVLFHEVLHTMADSLDRTLAAEFRARGMQAPSGLTHAFIFYTAGALLKREIAGHVPYGEKYGLWSRSPAMARALPLLRESWQRYLDGEIGFEEAIRRYVTGMMASG